MSTTICLIIPCYNEAGRLDFGALTQLPSGVTCLLVDDGSHDGTADLIKRHTSDRLRLLVLAKNVGKAEAVRRGMLHARASGLLERADWVGYWDADLATPLAEVPHFIAYLAMTEGRVDGILGSRVDRLGSQIVRSYRRHIFGRMFMTAVSVLLRLHCYDSQCGAKLFRPELVGQAFDEPLLSRWIFDVEILLRLRNCRLIEYPLAEWRDVKGSKLSLVKVAAPTLIDLLRIWRRYGRGARPGPG